jgi:hypothetical protein
METRGGSRITGPGVVDMETLALRLKEADPILKRELRRKMKAAAGPLVRDVQAAILSAPSHHGGNLRAEIAATVSASVGISPTRGVALNILSRGSKMPPGKGTLPMHFNDDRRFHHPVFGREQAEAEAVAARRSLGKGAGRGHGRGWTWVHQFGHANGWFDDTISQGALVLRMAVQAAMNETKRKLEH